MGGEEQSFARIWRKALVFRLAAYGVEPLALFTHPVGEVSGQARQRDFGALHLIRLAGPGCACAVAQLAGVRRDHFMIAERGDLWRAGWWLGHGGWLPHASCLALSSRAFWRMTSAAPPLRR